MPAPLQAEAAAGPAGQRRITRLRLPGWMSGMARPRDARWDRGPSSSTLSLHHKEEP